MRGRYGVVLIATATAVIYVTIALTMFPSRGPSEAVPRKLRQQQRHLGAAPASSSVISIFMPSVINAEVLQAGASTPQRRVSCPMFSGPGYDKTRHPSHGVSIPALAAPFRQSAPRPAPRLEPVPLSDVRLRPGSFFERAFATNLAFLKSVDIGALLLTWRLNMRGGGWPKNAMRLMGWEHTGSELRGHFLGHWLSAAAMSYAATADAQLEAHIVEVISALDELGSARGGGYLSAFPASFLDRLEAITPVWAPYYTLHKLIAGLLSVARLDAADAPTRVRRAAASALKLASALADYIDGRVQRLIGAKSMDYHFETLNQECGGINDALWLLATATDEPRHKALASYFDKPCLLGPLAAGRDELTGMHGNTALALVIGAARRHEVTGEVVFAAVSARFFGLVDGSRSYATGGSTHNELWGRPNELGHTLGVEAGGMRYEHVETCTTHNMMRLAEMLLRASSGGVRYAEWIERALINGVLGTQRGEEPGAYLYFMPLGAGVSKAAPQAWRHAGWSTAYGDFWCCQGTGVEAFARMAELIYFQSVVSGQTQGRVPELHVTQLISSTLQWRRGGLRLTLDAAAPGAVHPHDSAGYSISIDATSSSGDGRLAALLLRVPGWARGASATLNGAPLLLSSTEAAPGAALVNGSYVRVERVWRVGDLVSLTLPMNLSLEYLADSRPRYSRLAAVLHGPVVLACIGCRQTALKLPPASLLNMLVAVPRSARTQLRSLHRPVGRGARPGTIVVSDGWLYAREGELPAPPFRHRRRGATDVSLAATFRELPGPANEQNLVAFEPITRPGCLVSAPPEGATAGAAAAGINGGEHPLQLRLVCASAETPLTAAQERAASWRRHDPLVPVAHGSFQSFESVTHRGFFMSTYGANVSDVHARASQRHAHAGPRLGEQLTPLILARKPPSPAQPTGFNVPSPFALQSSFEEAIGETEYPASAWWWRPSASSQARGGKSALLYPLFEVVDEHYSVYWDLV